MSQSVTITTGGTATATGTYTQGTGSLNVTISPSAAVTAGAQWQVDGGTWRNSGTTATGLTTGTHTVAYKAVTGWNTPASQSLTISSGATATATGTYTQGTGSLTVTISPAAAVTAGAQWQVDGGAWRNSGTTATGLTAGTHTVAFKAITGWNTPASKSVTIVSGTTTTTTGTYTQVTTGSLTVTISPAAAVTAGGAVAGGRRDLAKQRDYGNGSHHRHAYGSLQGDHRLDRSGEQVGNHLQRDHDQCDGDLYPGDDGITHRDDRPGWAAGNGGCSVAGGRRDLAQ